LIHDPADLGKAELLLDQLGGVETVRVAHDATEVAAASDLPLAAQWESVTRKPLRKSLAEILTRDVGNPAHRRSRDSLAAVGPSSTISRVTSSFTNRSTSFSAVLRSTSKHWWMWSMTSSTVLVPSRACQISVAMRLRRSTSSSSRS